MTIKPKTRRVFAARHAARLAFLEAPGSSIVPDGTEGPANPRKDTTEAPAGKPLQIRLDLSTRRAALDIDAHIDLKGPAAGGPVLILHDTTTKGLRLRVGARTATWYHAIDKITKGDRTVRLKEIGRYDRGTRDEVPIRAPWHMDAPAARDAATVKGASYVLGTEPDNATAGLTFGDAFAQYLDFLQTKADNADKPARWRKNAKALGSKHLLPKFQKWTLVDMSQRREAVGAWYNALAKDTPTTAHHCRRLISAVYAFKRDRGAKLPADNPALAPVDKLQAHKTKAGKKALPRVRSEQFPAWAAAWRELPSPMHRAYWAFLLLTGTRPGELIRTVWTDLDLTHNTITIGNSKNGSDIVIPLSEPIIRVLDLAREAATDKKAAEIFHGPNSEHWPHRDPPLGVPGNGMRRTFKAIAGALGIPDETSKRLQGHKLSGIGGVYDDPLEVVRGEFLREQQARVSARMLELLGSDITREKVKTPPAKPAGPSAAQVAYWKRGERNA